MKRDIALKSYTTTTSELVNNSKKCDKYMQIQNKFLNAITVLLSICIH